ncbi:MAG: hypothetical protein OXF79_20850 [Chloroflexi bacterium]|nr:hypothetical protein [Chloroflexota bacterium]
MVKTSTVDDLNALMSELSAKADDLRADLQTTEHQIQSLQTTLAVCESRVGAGPDPTRYGLHSHVKTSEIDLGMTYMEMAKDIARRTGGIFKLADGCKIISDAKGGKPSPSGVKSSLHGQFSQSDEWDTERGTGLYRLISFDNVGTGTKEEEPRSNEYSTVDTGDSSPYISQSEESPVSTVCR